MVWHTRGVRILRVFNNNVVLARDALGREVVATGRGLAFGRKAGQDLDESLIARRYVTAQDAGLVGQMLSEIPLGRIALIEEIFTQAVKDLGATITSAGLIAVVDHVHQALERARRGERMDYPLRAEVAHLHPEELRLAERMVADLNSSQAIRLPEGEAFALALHLFAAATGAASIQDASAQSRIVAQAIELIDDAVPGGIDRDSIHAARFATHLRYFLARARGGAQIDDGTAGLIAESLRRRYPAAFRLAEDVASLLAERIGVTIRADETSYLAIHIARLLDSSIDGKR